MIGQLVTILLLAASAASQSDTKVYTWHQSDIKIRPLQKRVLLPPINTTFALENDAHRFTPQSLDSSDSFYDAASRFSSDDEWPDKIRPVAVSKSPHTHLGVHQDKDFEKKKNLSTGSHKQPPQSAQEEQNMQDGESKAISDTETTPIADESIVKRVKTKSVEPQAEVESGAFEKKPEAKPELTFEHNLSDSPASPILTHPDQNEQKIENSDVTLVHDSTGVAYLSHPTRERLYLMLQNVVFFEDDIQFLKDIEEFQEYGNVLPKKKRDRVAYIETIVIKRNGVPVTRQYVADGSHVSGRLVWLLAFPYKYFGRSVLRNKARHIAEHMPGLAYRLAKKKGFWKVDTSHAIQFPEKDRSKDQDPEIGPSKHFQVPIEQGHISQERLHGALHVPGRTQWRNLDLDLDDSSFSRHNDGERISDDEVSGRTPRPFSLTVPPTADVLRFFKPLRGMTIHTDGNGISWVGKEEGQHKEIPETFRQSSRVLVPSRTRDDVRQFPFDRIHLAEYETPRPEFSPGMSTSPSDTSTLTFHNSSPKSVQSIDPTSPPADDNDKQTFSQGAADKEELIREMKGKFIMPELRPSVLISQDSASTFMASGKKIQDHNRGKHQPLRKVANPTPSTSFSSSPEERQPQRSMISPRPMKTLESEYFLYPGNLWRYKMEKVDRHRYLSTRSKGSEIVPGLRESEWFVGEDLLPKHFVYKGAKIDGLPVWLNLGSTFKPIEAETRQYRLSAIIRNHPQLAKYFVLGWKQKGYISEDQEYSANAGTRSDGAHHSTTPLSATAPVAHELLGEKLPKDKAKAKKNKEQNNTGPPVSEDRERPSTQSRTRNSKKKSDMQDELRKRQVPTVSQDSSALVDVAQRKPLRTPLQRYSLVYYPRVSAGTGFFFRDKDRDNEKKKEKAALPIIVKKGLLGRPPVKPSIDVPKASKETLITSAVTASFPDDRSNTMERMASKYSVGNGVSYKDKVTRRKELQDVNNGVASKQSLFGKASPKPSARPAKSFKNSAKASDNEGKERARQSKKKQEVGPAGTSTIQEGPGNDGEKASVDGEIGDSTHPTDWETFLGAILHKSGAFDPDEPLTAVEAVLRSPRYHQRVADRARASIKRKLVKLRQEICLAESLCGHTPNTHASTHFVGKKLLGQEWRARPPKGEILQDNFDVAAAFWPHQSKAQLVEAISKQNSHSSSRSSAALPQDPHRLHASFSGAQYRDVFMPTKADESMLRAKPPSPIY